MILIKKSIALLLCVLLPAASVGAQVAHVVDTTELYRLMDRHVDREQAQRDLLQRVLQRAEVRQVAERFGLDVERAEAAVTTLESEELDRLAARAQVVEESLNGGATIVITTTAIIIALLIVILVIVATD